MRAIVYIVAALLVLVGLAIAALETGWAKNQIRNLIVRQANQYLTATLEIGRLGGSILRGISLGDVRLTKDGQTLVAIDDVSLNYSIRELVEGGVFIRRLSLVRPRVVAARQPDGRWNLAAIVNRRPPQQGGPARPIHIEDIEIEDGAISIQSPLTFGAAHVPSRYDDLDARFTFDRDPSGWRLRFDHASWKGAPNELTVNSLDGGIGSGSDGWAFDHVAVETPQSGFTLDGTIDRRQKPTVLDLRIDARRFAFQEWGGVLSALRNIAITGPFKTRLRGPLAKLTTDLDMQNNGGGVRGTLVLDTTVPGWHGAGTLDIQRLDLAPWFNRPDRPSDITGRVQFDLDLRLGHWPAGSYTFDGSHTRFMDYEADDLKARGRITLTEVQIAQATATAYGSNVRLTSGSIAISDPYQFRFVGTALGVDLRRVPKAVPVPHVESTLAFEYDVTGQFVRPYIQGHARFSDSEFLGARIGPGAVGSIDTLAQPFTYAGEGDLSDIDLHRFGAGLAVSWMQEPRYAGMLSGRFHVKGAGSELATMVLEGGGRLVRADMFGGRLTDADVAIDIARGTLSATYDGNIAAINPALALEDGFYEASLTGNGRGRIVVQDLLTRSPTLADYTIDASMTLVDSTVRRVAVSRGALDATLSDNGALTVRRMAVSGPAIDAQGSGVVQFDGERSSAFDYSIARADLAQLEPVIHSRMGGDLTTSGRLTGPTGSLRLVGEGTGSSLDAAGVKALRLSARYDATIPTAAPATALVNLDGRAEFVTFGGQQVQQASGTVDYADGRIAVDLAVQQREDITGRIAAGFVLNATERWLDVESAAITFRRGVWRLAQAERPRVSWDPEGFAISAMTLEESAGGQRITARGTWRADGSGALLLAAENVFLDTFAPPSQQPVRYGGVADLQATLTGTRDHPLLTGELTITNGRIRRLSYQKFAGRIDYVNQALRVDVRLDQAPGVWLTANGTVPLSTFDRSLPEEPVDLAVQSSSISLTLIEGVTDVVRNVTGELRVNVHVVGTSRDPHFDGAVDIANAGFVVAASGARYKNATAALRLARDRVTVQALRVEDRDGHALELRGSLGTHELKVGELEVDATARQFEVMRNDYGRIAIDAQVSLRGQFESPRVTGRLTITSGDLQVDSILDRVLFQPYSTQAAAPPTELDPLAALNPWDRLGLDLELHVPNTLRLLGENVQVTPGTPLGLGDIGLRALGDLYLYKDPAQPLYVNGSFDQVTGTYTFQGRRFDLDPSSSITFRGDLNPELFVTVTRIISGVETRVTIAGGLRQPELRLASTPPLDPSDILSLIVFNTSTNELSALQQRELAVRAGTLAAGFLAAPIMSALERSLGISTLEIEPDTGIGARAGARVTIGDEIAPGLVARFSRQFGEDVYDEATIEYYLSRILRIRATFSDAASTIARSPFRRVERAGIDLLLYFSF